MLAVDNLGREQRTHFLAEIFLQNLLVQLAHVVDVQNIDVLHFQLLTNLIPSSLGSGADFVDTAKDGINLTGGIEPGLVVEFVRLQDTLVVQGANPNHEEFVQIGKINREEL